MHIHQEELSQSVFVYSRCPRLILEQGAKCVPQSRVLGRRRQFHGGVEDGCVPRRESVDRAQRGHQVGDNHWN